MKLRLITGSSNLELANEIAKHSGISLTKCTIKKFRDGETYVRINESVRGDDVFVIQSTSQPVNDTLMELLIMIDALKRASAGRITAVIPYYGYARQDRKAEAREPITAKLAADMITIAGAHRVLACDLHVPQIQGFFEIPVDEISAIPAFARYFEEKKISDPVIVATDAGAAKKARSMAKLLKCPIAIIDKRRSAHNEAEVINIVGDVEGKTAILLDDIIDTGNSVIHAAEVIAEKASEVYICASHAVFSDGCPDRLANSPAKEIVVTNSIAAQCTNKKIRVLSLAKLLAEVIRNINENSSVSELFI
jgi:ribose-phosphate pyrophosphokinase